MTEINRTEGWMWDDVKGSEQESYAVYDAIESALKQHMRESVMGFQRGYRPLDALTFTLDRNTGEVILSKPDPEPLTPEQEREIWLDRNGYDAAVEFYMGTKTDPSTPSAPVLRAGWYVECSHCTTVPVPHLDSIYVESALTNAEHHVRTAHGIEDPIIHRGDL